MLIPKVEMGETSNENSRRISDFFWGPAAGRFGMGKRQILHYCAIFGVWELPGFELAGRELCVLGIPAGVFEFYLCPAVKPENP